MSRAIPSYVELFLTLLPDHEVKTVSCSLACAPLRSTAFAGLGADGQRSPAQARRHTVGERYAPQMELQGLALNAARPGAEAERAELATDPRRQGRRRDRAAAGSGLGRAPARVYRRGGIGPGPDRSAQGADAELKECARRALEKNPAPAATESLRAALQKGGDSKWTIGLIQSLGERRDTGAVAPIDKAMARPETAFAAACALAKIHNESAVNELWDAFEQKLPVAADALLDAAHRLEGRNDSKRAEAIYARLYTSCEGVQRRAAALNGLAQVAPAQAKKLIPAALSISRYQAAANRRLGRVPGLWECCVFGTGRPAAHPERLRQAVRARGPGCLGRKRNSWRLPRMRTRRCKPPRSSAWARSAPSACLPLLVKLAADNASRRPPKRPLRPLAWCRVPAPTRRLRSSPPKANPRLGRRPLTAWQNAMTTAPCRRS